DAGQLEMHGGLGDYMRADRSGNKKKQRDKKFMQAQTVAAGTEKNHRADNGAAHAQSGGLGGSVQAHVEIRQSGQTNGAYKRETGADKQKKRDGYFQYTWSI